MRHPVRRTAVAFIAAVGSVLCVCVATPLPADATVGHTWGLDPSFGGDGTVTTRFPGSVDEADWAEDVAVQPDGRIVVVGSHTDYGSDDGRDFIATRYLPDGALDPSFGDEGLLRLSVASEQATAVSLQEIGGVTKIVIVGELYDKEQVPEHPVLVVRLNPDGSLDTDHDADPTVHFDHDGMATVVFQEQNSGAEAVTVDSQNRIVIVGRTTWEWDDPTPALLARLRPDGRPDRTFGTNGQAVIYPEGLSAGYQAIQVLRGADGADRFVLCGWAYDGVDSLWVVSRLLANGSADREFGDGDGHVIFPMRVRGAPEPSGEALGIAADSNGALAVVGTHRMTIVGGAISVPVMVRLTPDGTFDRTFSGNGKVHLGTDQLSSRDAVDVTLDDDGVAYWVGTREWPTGGQNEWVLVGGRKPDGSKDRRFSRAGSTAVSFGPAGDDGMAIAMDADHRLVVTGRAWPTGDSIQLSLGLARLTLS